MLRHTRWSDLCVGILLIELHGSIIEKSEHTAYTFGDAYRGVKALEAVGFLHYSSEAVCGMCAPPCPSLPSLPAIYGCPQSAIALPRAPAACNSWVPHSSNTY